MKQQLSQSALSSLFRRSDRRAAPGTPKVRTRPARAATYYDLPECPVELHPAGMENADLAPDSGLLRLYMDYEPEYTESQFEAAFWAAGGRHDKTAGTGLGVAVRAADCAGADGHWVCPKLGRGGFAGVGKMRAVTLHQPYASFIAWGEKGPETRSWACPPSLLGKRIAIHASSAIPAYAKELCMTEPFSTVIGLNLRENAAGDFYLSEVLKRLPLGAVVATCVVERCVRTEDVRVPGQKYEADDFAGQDGTLFGPDEILWITEQQFAFGDYRPGRFAWVLKDIQPLADPIPARGFQKIWNWETDIGMEVKQ